MDTLNALWLSQKELNVADIVKLTGLSRRQTYRALQNLKKKDFIKYKVIKEMKFKGLCYTTYSISNSQSIRRAIEYKLNKYQRNGE
jgi:DNA-binding transcriptional regulator GbsR (MarR family)